MGGLGTGTIIVKKGKELLLDPEKGEEEGAAGVISIGVMPALGKITGLWLSGELEVEHACTVSGTF